MGSFGLPTIMVASKAGSVQKGSARALIFAPLPSPETFCLCRSRGSSATRVSGGCTRSAHCSTAARTRTSTPATTAPTASSGIDGSKFWVTVRYGLSHGRVVYKPCQCRALRRQKGAAVSLTTWCSSRNGNDDCNMMATM